MTYRYVARSEADRKVCGEPSHDDLLVGVISSICYEHSRRRRIGSASEDATPIHLNHKAAHTRSPRMLSTSSEATGFDAGFACRPSGCDAMGTRKASVGICRARWAHMPPSDHAARPGQIGLQAPHFRCSLVRRVGQDDRTWDVSTVLIRCRVALIAPYGSHI